MQCVHLSNKIKTINKQKLISVRTFGLYISSNLGAGTKQRKVLDELMICTCMLYQCQENTLIVIFISYIKNIFHFIESPMQIFKQYTTHVRISVHWAYFIPMQQSTYVCSNMNGNGSQSISIRRTFIFFGCYVVAKPFTQRDSSGLKHFD